MRQNIGNTAMSCLAVAGKNVLPQMTAAGVADPRVPMPQLKILLHHHVIHCHPGCAAQLPPVQQHHSQGGQQHAVQVPMKQMKPASGEAQDAENCADRVEELSLLDGLSVSPAVRIVRSSLQ